MKSSIQNTNLANIIVGPLNAIFDAQDSISKRMVKLIESIAYEEGTKKIKMVSFTYTKKDNRSEDKNYTLNIPLLTLVPINSLNIDNVEFGFDLVVDNISRKSSNQGTSQGVDEVGLRVYFPPTISKTSESMNMKIKMNVKSSSMPPGLVNLLKVMDNASIQESA
jgi:hypothetical protein